jgi:hypothetical protein
MALKNMIKVGDKVTFGRSGELKQSGTVIKCNPKTARIKVSRCGEFLVTYNLIQKPRKAVATKKAPAKRKAAPRKKATGKKICAVPVAGPRMKKNPSTRTRIQKGKLYRIKGTTNTIEKTSWGAFLVRDKHGNEIGKRSTKAAALNLAATGTKKNPPYGQELQKFRKKHRQPSDWGEDTRGFSTTQPDFYEEEVTGQWAPMQTRPNPAGFTKKGEKLYLAIKKGYGRDPRAKEIAARIVYSIARDKPGLVKRPRRRTLRQ